MKKLIIVAIATFALTACEKEISLDLNSADPKLIIEGNITNEKGPYLVQLAKTVNFSEANTYPAVTGASVVITDRTSNTTDVLTENSAGLYTTHDIQGVVGHSYELIVRTDGQTYTASTTMPTSVPLDSIAFVHGNNLGNRSVRAAPYFQDPAGVANFYTFTQSVNDRKVKRTFTFGDRLSDGRYITQQLFADSAYISVGDRVMIQMNCVDQHVWNYFNTLALQAGGGPGAPAPANPTSNISNNALGYFSAHTVQTRTAIAK